MSTTEAREAPTCNHCGARAQRLDEPFCTYCGAELPRHPAPPSSPPAPGTSTGFGNLPARFGALRLHPNFFAAADHVPSAAGTLAQSGFQVLLGVLFAAVALGMMQVTGSIGAPGLVRLFPLFFVAVGVYVVGKAFLRGARLATSELAREPVLVVDKRSDVHGDRDSARTNYFVTLEDERGERSEFAVRGQVFGVLRPGDLGVAFLRSDVLLDFRRVPV